MQGYLYLMIAETVSYNGICRVNLVTRYTYVCLDMFQSQYMYAFLNNIYNYFHMCIHFSFHTGGF